MLDRRPFARLLLACSTALLSACAEPPPVAPAQAERRSTASASAAPSSASPSSKDPFPWTLRGKERLVADAERLSPLVETDWTRQFLDRAKTLRNVEKRQLFVNADKSRYYTEAEASALPPDQKAALKPYPVDEEEYYNTHYGSPLSYSRPLDVLAARGVTLSAGQKYLDFGYGYIGHIQMLASLGVHVTGVDVWPFLRAAYSFPGDQGDFTGPSGEKGSVRLLDGRFPADAAITTAVGSGYTLIISKNVLKRGYLHPERPVEKPERLIHLDVTDEVAIKAFFDALVPGGHFLIYNICPAPSPPDKPFIPWSDGRSPFTKAQLEAAGFEILEFDKDDLKAVQTMARALGWDQTYDGEPGIDVVNDLSVLYTLVRKPAKR